MPRGAVPLPIHGEDVRVFPFFMPASGGLHAPPAPRMRPEASRASPRTRFLESQGLLDQYAKAEQVPDCQEGGVCRRHRTGCHLRGRHRHRRPQRLDLFGRRRGNRSCRRIEQRRDVRSSSPFACTTFRRASTELRGNPRARAQSPSELPMRATGSMSNSSHPWCAATSG